VLAAATAEACTCAGSTVGVALGAHALNININTVATINIGFIFLASFLYFGANGFIAAIKARANKGDLVLLQEFRIDFRLAGQDAATIRDV